MVDETAYRKSVCGVRKRESWRELENAVLRGRQTEEAQKEVTHRLIDQSVPPNIAPISAVLSQCRHL